MRLIDADALIEQMEADAEQMEELLAKMFAYATINDVKHSPTVQPKPRWIPCSKKLPSDEDYDETFTVTIQCEHYGGWDDYVTGYADWTPHGWDIQSNYIGQIKVTAWMPLPEPYEEDKQND